ncbi:hypothetical protein ACIPVK_07565 [Paeniglutamicibacter sp. MACA_103]|uniref:hypothetical protein n=1 Tax=Paeniglutamicibacter sp. MACA_103 TaxID=3377337 RepID=UPI00389639D2
MSGEPEAPRRRKPRRFTAPPQQVSDSTLVGVFELPHGAGRTAPGPSTDADAAPGTAVPGTAAAPGESDDKPRTAHERKAPNDRKAKPVLDQQAAEDDPRRWGDAEDDLGDWLKSQRPPHWD